MARWTVDEPTKIDFDGVVALKANIVAGTVSVLPSDHPTLQVSEISGHPLEVVHEAGMLSLTQKSSGVEGIVRWLQNTSGRTAITVTVPRTARSPSTWSPPTRSSRACPAASRSKRPPAT